MKWVVRTIDFLLGILLLCYLSVLFIFIFLLRLIPKQTSPQKVSLILTSGTSAANAKRNIDQWYSACLLDGYFSKIFFIYFIGDTNRYLRLGEEISIFDFRSTVATVLKTRGFSLSAPIFQFGHFIYFLFKVVRDQNVTHLEANDPYLEGLALSIVSALTGVPYFIRFNCDYEFYYREFKRMALSSLKYRWLERAIGFVVLRRAQGVMALYRHYRKSAIHEGARSVASIAAPPLLDISYWQSDANVPLRYSPFVLASHPTMIYLGRLSWDKYCLDLIDVLVGVKAKIPNVRLVILGDGELRAQFEKKAVEMGVFENIYFPGFLPPTEICAWGRVAKVMLATHGGFSLIEMGAQGVPIVAYAHDWHREIVHDGETGLIANFRDTQMMAAQAIDLIQHPEKAKELGAKLKKLVHAEYHPMVAKRVMREFIASRCRV